MFLVKIMVKICDLEVDVFFFGFLSHQLDLGRVFVFCKLMHTLILYVIYSIL